MRAEHVPPEWVFRHAGEAVDGQFGLVVLDGASDDVRVPVGVPVLRLA